jgi:hypothetical protein
VRRCCNPTGANCEPMRQISPARAAGINAAFFAAGCDCSRSLTAAYVSESTRRGTQLAGTAEEYRKP